MDEAKTLLHHALSALFAVLILAAVMSLIGLGHMMWSAFSLQDAANQRMRNYSKYAAFDSTTIRGQEVVALLHNTQGSPWVIITGNDRKPVNVIYTHNEIGFSLDDSFKDNQTNSDAKAILESFIDQGYVTLESLIKQLLNTANLENETKTYEPDNEDHIKQTAMNFTSTASKPSYAEVQQWFLNRGDGDYLPYKSYLLYEDSYTTDIVGILLVEQKGGGS